MASLQLLLPRRKFLSNPYIFRFLSSSPDLPHGPPANDASNGDSHPFASSKFSDVKASLKQPPPQRPKFSEQREQPTTKFQPQSSKVVSLEEIGKNLSGFRRRTAAESPSEQISFQELYKRNHADRVTNSGSNFGESAEKSSGKTSFDAIRESLRRMKTETPGQRRVASPMSLSSFKNSLKLTPASKPQSGNVIGGTEALPVAIFGKEMVEKSERDEGVRSSMKTEFVKMYSYDELGDKLRKLRPEVGKKEKEGWFSLGELNERLVKLRDMEEKETSRSGILGYGALRECFVKLKSEDKTKQFPIQRLDILSHLGGTPDFMLQPPKEQLVEKYFHPDNMSASEKMKTELAKVREDFKMSESDCGSARVQVAQLTTKIKYLSSALHKKDKHSRKGLIAMVQRRKKLLKYLRRTDWESYCLVLDKLGLRDNPDLKF